MRQPAVTGCAAIKLTGSPMGGMSAVAPRALTARAMCRLSAGAFLAGSTMYGMSGVAGDAHRAARTMYTLLPGWVLASWARLHVAKSTVCLPPVATTAPARRRRPALQSTRLHRARRAREDESSSCSGAVSYTHLTLPTILLV
eukprot:2588433-Pyramimonas_sp.AAC.1